MVVDHASVLKLKRAQVKWAIFGLSYGLSFSCRTAPAAPQSCAMDKGVFACNSLGDSGVQWAHSASSVACKIMSRDFGVNS